MADELFLQAETYRKRRRFDRRLGLAIRDERKSCGTRFLSNLENAIFSRAADPAGALSSPPFPRRNPARG